MTSHENLKHKHKQCVFRLNKYTFYIISTEYIKIKFHGNYPLFFIIDIK